MFLFFHPRGALLFMWTIVENIPCKSVFMILVVAGQELRQVQGQGLGQGFLWWLQKSLGSLGNSAFFNQTPNCFNDWRSLFLQEPLFCMESFDRSTIVTNTICVNKEWLSTSVRIVVWPRQSQLWWPWPQRLWNVCIKDSIEMQIFIDDLGWWFENHPFSVNHQQAMTVEHLLAILLMDNTWLANLGCFF